MAGNSLRINGQIRTFAAEHPKSWVVPLTTWVEQDAEAVEKLGGGETTAQALKVAIALESAEHRVQVLKTQRSTLKGIAYQSDQAEFLEFLGIMLTAFGFGLTIGLHPIFICITLPAYWVYKKATEQTRIKQKANEDLAEVIKSLKEVTQAETELKKEWTELTEKWPATSQDMIAQGHRIPTAKVNLD